MKVISFLHALRHGNRLKSADPVLLLLNLIYDQCMKSKDSTKRSFQYRVPKTKRESRSSPLILARVCFSHVSVKSRTFTKGLQRDVAHPEVGQVRTANDV